MPKPITITWLSQPEKHDYSAAKSFLSLLYRKPQTRTSVRKLRQAPVSEYKAKDIFRASGLSQLGLGNSHVERDRQTITSGQRYPRSCSYETRTMARSSLPMAIIGSVRSIRMTKRRSSRARSSSLLLTLHRS
jgi:hypothetical protein